MDTAGALIGPLAFAVLHAAKGPLAGTDVNRGYDAVFAVSGWTHHDQRRVPYLLLRRRLDLPAQVFPLLLLATAAVFLLLAVPVGMIADRISRSRIFLVGRLALLIVYALALTASAGAIACCSRSWLCTASSTPRRTAYSRRLPPMPYRQTSRAPASRWRAVDRRWNVSSVRSVSVPHGPRGVAAPRSIRPWSGLFWAPRPRRLSSDPPTSSTKDPDEPHPDRSFCSPPWCCSAALATAAVLRSSADATAERDQAAGTPQVKCE
ncbi:hypothetical protein [Streptomyces sp. NBC_00879]|uniref:hypothetical protein n=1 Tax=Streptomyces sp. NBC_00879 TaxID=2975855 RepID=UPI0038699AFD